MDVKSFVDKLTIQQKIKLVHGQGAWHTQQIGQLPSMMMTDGPHGLRKQKDGDSINQSNKSTCFPTACAVACSFNKNNAQLIAQSIATEAIAEDVSVVLGPGVNVKRSPLCGRNFEYFSEDPFLAGELATSYVNAMQQSGVGCSLKHFAVNSQETRRMTVNAIVDERALREIYLTAFEKVVKNAQPSSIMIAYNALNGSSCAQNKRLLSIARDEWGFDGLFVSDWGACYDMAQSINAGMDLEMPQAGKYHEQKLLNAYNDGTLDKQALDRACQNVAKWVQKYGAPRQKVKVDYDAHHQLCKQVSNDCAVLLRNEDNVLPLTNYGKLLVVGEMAEKPRFQGAGSSHVNATCPNFLSVLTQNGVNFQYAKGYRVSGDVVDEQLQSQAVSLASQADTVLFFGGLTDDFEGEGYDRSKLDIPTCQQTLLRCLAKVNSNVVFVAFGGSPFTMPWLKDTKALLNMYLGGQAVMESAYDLLFGKVCPSGRLAESYPLSLADTPCYNYFANDKYLDEHRESIFVGYRYYNTFNVPVLFPFGYGLSYCQFDYSNFTAQVTPNGVTLSVTVTNNGNMTASHVLQAYVDNCNCGYMRAKRELRGFEKVLLQAGESKVVTILLDERAFSIFDGQRFVKVAGQYGVSLCSDVNTVVCAQQVQIDGENVCGKDEQSYPCYYQKPSGSFFVNEHQFYALCNMQKPVAPTYEKHGFTMLSTIEQAMPHSRLFRRIAKMIKKVAIKQSPTKSFADPVAQMIYHGAIETPYISMMGVGGVPARYVVALYRLANKQWLKALGALFGIYKIM